MRATFLSRFTPSLMSPQALEAIFVQREALADRLVTLIRESAMTESKHHSLLIGPRGIGKTHLVSLVCHRIRAMADLRDQLVVAWLREEEWGVASFLDLLLRIIRALEAEHADSELAEKVASIHELPPEAAEQVAARALLDFLEGRTLLILVENLDEIFDGLGDEGQKMLRAYLQENPHFTILATAPSLFNGVSLQTSPFYGFFQIHHLQQVEIEEATELLTKIAALDGDDELASFVPTANGRARIRTVHHLAGGNHRVYVIFSQFLTRDSLDEVVEPFMRTLDDLTPYYQERMRWLSPQQRKIVEFLCDIGSAVRVKQIAQRCFMTPQTAASQLKCLRDMGYVQSHSIGRESYYELREPLMRLCVEVKRNRGEPIRLFVDFLRLWYSRAELRQRLGLLPPEAALERAHVLQALEMSQEESEPPRVAACLKDYDERGETGDFGGASRVAEGLVAVRGAASPVIVTDQAVRDILERIACRATRRERVEALIRIYRQHGRLAVLAQGVTRSIPALRLPEVGREAASSWRDVWQELAGDFAEFRIPLQLLDVAVRYMENEDERILLELPTEQRSVLESLLRGDEEEAE